MKTRFEFDTGYVSGHIHGHSEHRFFDTLDDLIGAGHVLIEVAGEPEECPKCARRSFSDAFFAKLAELGASPHTHQLVWKNRPALHHDFDMQTSTTRWTASARFAVIPYNTEGNTDAPVQQAQDQ